MNKSSLKLMLAVVAVVGASFVWRYTQNKRVAESQPVFAVINVLDKDTHDDCHIKGSINVPYPEFDKYSNDLHKDSEVVVYCSNYRCSASGAAAKSLKAKGFKKVKAYEAGLADWFQQGLPVEGPSKAPYLQMKIEKPTGEPEDYDVITTAELKTRLGH